MNSTPISFASGLVSRRSQFVRFFSLLAALSAFAGALMAQDNGAAQDNNGNDRRGRRGQNGQDGAGGGRGNFNPEEMQTRMLSALREQFGVTDDAEWKLISDRILAVNEIRRTTMGGMGGLGSMGGFRGAPGGGPGGGQGGGGRFGRGGGNPESDALRQSITDKLPDAEVKSRLARLREARKANEERLTKAQEDLRALLSVRQEAILVMAGLLP